MSEKHEYAVFCDEEKIATIMAPTVQEAIREINHYLMMYRGDGLSVKAMKRVNRKWVELP